MAKSVNVYEAKTLLSELVDRASAGEEIVIAQSGIPTARLVPLDRLLLAQSRVEWQTLVTADRRLSVYGVKVIDARR